MLPLEHHVDDDLAIAVGRSIVDAAIADAMGGIMIVRAPFKLLALAGGSPAACARGMSNMHPLAVETILLRSGLLLGFDALSRVPMAGNA